MAYYHKESPFGSGLDTSLFPSPQESVCPMACYRVYRHIERGV